MQSFIVSAVLLLGQDRRYQIAILALRAILPIHLPNVSPPLVPITEVMVGPSGLHGSYHLLTEL